VHPDDRARVLDVCTGTGDLALAAESAAEAGVTKKTLYDRFVCVAK
jgi:ubiquinone/menaquinone biosynthesis C-methylase UbiE